MKHIIDETYRGHELVFIEANDLICVDIRTDGHDGEFIQSYSDLLTVFEARLLARGFIDGMLAYKKEDA